MTYKRPTCQMPGCSVEVPDGQKYCEACQWVKDQDIQRAKTFKELGNLAVLAGLAILWAVATPAMAYDVSQNPDRVPSIGLDLWKGQIAGMDRQTSETNGGTVGGQADFRLPVSNALTVHFFGESEGVNNNLRYTDGYKVGLGLRVFLQ